MNPATRVILIGGTSHVGKSTLAAAWSAALGWPLLSTDSLGRHPGRPWPTPAWTVPDHVVAHYRTQDAEALLAAQLEHYRNMWPLVARIVGAHATAPLGGLVLEGSGCWPDEVLTLASPHVAALWVTGDADLIARRIRRESRYEGAGAESRALIDAFTARSTLYDARMRERLAALGLPAIDAADEEPGALVKHAEALLHRLT